MGGGEGGHGCEWLRIVVRYSEPDRLSYNDCPTMSSDTLIFDACGGVIASFGPRKVASESGSPEDSLLEVASDEDAEFWSVFRHDAEGFARCVGDAVEPFSAQHFAGIVARAAPLTIAHVAIGAHRYWTQAASPRPINPGRFLEEIIGFAPAIERLVDGHGDLCGVDLLSMAEAFGAWSAGILTTKGALPADEVARYLTAYVADTERATG